MSEPALRFLVDLVEAEGGIAEDRGDSVLLLVAPALREQLGLPEELTATDDPEVASEEGALLAVPGQALVVDAAEAVLRRGDAGWRHLDWPSSPPPTAERLEQAARDAFPVDHGRIDVEGQPTARWLPVLQVAALIEHRVSVEQRHEERAEVWVDARTGISLPAHLADALGAVAGVPGAGAGHVRLEPSITPAVRAAHHVLDGRAAERQAALVHDARRALHEERERVDAYYRAALASIDVRRISAAPDRARLYDAQEETTRAEWSRRREETEAKFAGSRAIVPFRLHLVEVPALEVPVTVRRGPRTFGLDLHWLLPFACFLPLRCPHCGAGAPLVAGRDRLGCRTCQTRAVTGGTSDRPTPTPAKLALAGPVGAPPPPADEPTGGPTLRRSGKSERMARSALRDKQVQKALHGVAMGFWQAVAEAERYGSVARRSPLEALYRCYGPAGPLCAVGLPPDAIPVRMRAAGIADDAGDVLATSGLVTTTEGTARFTLRWRLTGRDPSVVEVLHQSPPRGGSSLPVPRRGRDALLAPVADPPRPAELGPVEALLGQHAMAGGLPLVVRCLALYWRVQGQRRLAPLGPGALAAAVETVTRRHSDLSGGPETAARRHGVPTAEVREACEALEVVVGAAADHLW